MSFLSFKLFVRTGLNSPSPAKQQPGLGRPVQPGLRLPDRVQRRADPALSEQLCRALPHLHRQTGIQLNL